MSAMKTRSHETALLLRIPRAEGAVARHRRQLDSAAADGIPAHVTVLYPFVPADDLREGDHLRLEELFAQQQPFSLVGRRTSWFGDRVLFVQLENPEPVRTLTAQVAAAYPGYPPYAGAIAHEDVLPHLTVGHDHPLPALREAEREVLASLPVEDLIDHVELWSGPAVSGRTTPRLWRHIRSYRLEAGDSLGR